MLQCGTRLLSGWLAGVVILFTLLDPIMVRCTTEGGGHQAIEHVSYRHAEPEQCQHHSDSDPSERHKHEDACSDAPMLEPATPPRSDHTVQSTQPPVAFMPIAFYWSTQANCQRQPRPPPLAWNHGPPTDLRVIRLLI